jgi:signal transduction histidine kinase
MERVVVRLEVEAAPASLELGRLVPAKGALLRQELGRELWAVGLVALLSAFLARAMGHWLIGGPLGRIADQVQRLGAGDLSRRLVPRGSREIYDLKVAINHTSDELAAARERASREKALREEAVAQLRHADRMRTVGTLAAGIAHELGTPLNVILLRAHMIARGELEGDDVKTSAATIAGQTERLTRIVRQLLDFARRKNPSRSPVDLRELALRTAALLGPLAAKRDVHLTVAGEQPVRAEVDGGQIEQALTNLVMNAVHASPRGAVVTLRAGFDGQEAILAVEDEGCGMAPEVLERVFEPFFTTKEPGEGTGLGLSVAFGIASDHGGRLDAASVPGRGSTFTLRLPTEQPTS